MWLSKLYNWFKSHDVDADEIHEFWVDFYKRESYNSILWWY